MASVAEIDQQILATSQEKDAVLAQYRSTIQALRTQREVALKQAEVNAMTEPEREAMRQALAQTTQPDAVVSQPTVEQPGGEQ